MKNSLISVSIDDGHPLDMKAAEILMNRGINTTFYIPIKNSTGRPTLNRKQIKWLSQQPNFEIGGHTYNHIDLTKVPLHIAKEEMRSGKEALEDIIGKPVTTFAWPWGRYNNSLLRLLNRVGFLNSRSACTLNLNSDVYRDIIWHPNLHIYPHIKTRGLVNSIKRGDFSTFISRLSRLNYKYINLLSFFKKQNKPYHFWFHSWEIDELNMWNYVEKL